MYVLCKEKYVKILFLIYLFIFYRLLVEESMSIVVFEKICSAIELKRIVWNSEGLRYFTYSLTKPNLIAGGGQHEGYSLP
jgi:hypothetical protein